MNSHFWIVLVLGVSLMGLSLASGGDKPEYLVSQVLKVRSLSEFDCKITGYPHAPSARFRVQVRGIEIDPQLPVEEAAEYLHERLKNAERVVLEKVQFRNYFRLIADVSIDGRDLGDELIRQGFTLPIEDSKTAADASMARPDENPPRRYQPAVSSSPATATRIERRTVTLQSLLETEVDLSLINDEITFQEALEIIADSVRPRLPFVILWNDLENNALIDKETPIGVGGFGKLKVNRALEIILHSVSRTAQTKLILVVEGQVMTLGTQTGLLQKSRVHSYSVDEVVSVPSSENSDNRRGN